MLNSRAEERNLSEKVKKILAAIEYAGEGFHGFQLQPGIETVQGLIESKLIVFFKNNVRIPVNICSRTDAGVRAKINLITFKVDVNWRPELDLNQMCISLSHLCKNRVSFLWARFVEPSFKLRQWVSKKLYRYYIVNRPSPPTFLRGLCYHVPKKLSLDRLNKLAQQLVGEHDFSSFRGRYCGSPSPVKTVFVSRFDQIGDLIVYTIVGSGFLHNMVRIIVGTLIDIHDKPELSIQMIMNAKNRAAAGRTAPAVGLCLEGFETVDGERLGDWSGVPPWDSSTKFLAGF